MAATGLPLLVCRTRQAKGARACLGRRIVADDLEAAVIGNSSTCSPTPTCSLKLSLEAFGAARKQRSGHPLTRPRARLR